MRRFIYGIGLAAFALAALISAGQIADVESVSYAQPTPTPTPAPPTPTPTPQPPKPSIATITFPKNGYSAEVGDFVEVVATTNCTRLKWVAQKNAQGYKLKGLPSRLVPDPACVIVSSPKAGVFKLEVYGSMADGTLSDPVWVTITFTDPDAPTPVPPGPTPPIPPTPPTPPAPIADAGFRVLMVYDDTKAMPQDQTDVLRSTTLRSYLNSKCAVGSDGKTKEWRIWDQSTNSSLDTPLWDAAFKRPRKSLPWILISTGKTGFEGPLPATVDDTLALLKQYGGE